MKNIKNHILLGLFFIIISALIYLLQYLVFHDSHTTLFYLMQDLAFVPINILLVTFILESLLAKRERESKLEKMNMVIGAFFSEVGTELISYCSLYDKDYDKDRFKIDIAENWTSSDFEKISTKIKNHKFNIDSTLYPFDEFKIFLLSKRNFLLTLLGNPILLDHDSFSELLWSIFHITDEFLVRKDLSSLKDDDYAHLSVDISRVFSLLVYEWIYYVKHIKSNYPYLFSLAVRENPFMKHYK